MTKYDFSTVVLLHTSQGILTNQQAIKNKIGGQVLFIFFS
jgi:ribosomal protein S8